jgi:hypothetical protein
MITTRGIERMIAAILGTPESTFKAKDDCTLPPTLLAKKAFFRGHGN